MAGLGLGVVWAGYYLTLWGYCLVKGYDVPFTALAKATWPGADRQPKAKAKG